MRILFQVPLHTALRHFTDVVLTLAGRGHQIVVASSDGRSDLPPPILLKDHPRIRFINSPGRRGDVWAERIHELRAVRDYLHYLEEPYRGATKLRARAMRKAMKAVTGGTHGHFTARCPHCEQKVGDDQLVGMLFAGHAGGAAALADRLALVEDAVPSDRSLEAFYRQQRPDVVLVTPLVKIGSYQADYVKSAKALGIPVGFPVFSWDNLSTKGLIHVLPDEMYVWNDRQKLEAVELHRVPAERVVVAGAPRFDRFFAMRPQISREQFCLDNNLDPAQPILVYLCSSEFVADQERDFVLQWIDEVRRHPDLAACNIAIRPHPREKGQWKKFSTGRDRVAVTFPESISTDQSLYDTIYHGAAVVGLNTSAELEAAIVGRPVCTILAPGFSGGQPNTLHFHYLVKGHGGFVEMAEDFETHRCHLAAAVKGQYDRQAIDAFVTSFLRPRGRDRDVSPQVADAIERLAAARRRSWWPFGGARG